ncbi:MAG: hypothetical protein HYW24_02215 [Candidatus Aenigmarchaeota archaeon]|nr:hypothetical protein [Candidatus Aenigmarchaeota archaeon]
MVITPPVIADEHKVSAIEQDGHSPEFYEQLQKGRIAKIRQYELKLVGIRTKDTKDHVTFLYSVSDSGILTIENWDIDYVKFNKKRELPLSDVVSIYNENGETLYSDDQNTHESQRLNFKRGLRERYHF